MSLSIRLNDVNYSFFTSAEVVRDIEKVASTFSFTATSGVETGFPIREGDKVEIIADDSYKILTGRVDKYKSSSSDKSHTVSIQGRSKTADLVDYQFEEAKTYSDITFITLCETIAKEKGIDVVNLAGDFGKVLINVSVKVGQKAFSVLRDFASNNQLLLTDNADGDLVITQASTDKSDLHLKKYWNGTDNNIKDSSKEVSLEGLASKYIVKGQLDILKQDDKVTAKEISDQSGEATDETIRESVKVILASQAANSETLKKQAQWKMATDRAKSFKYNCDVQGHVTNGEVWDINKIYQVNDDPEEMHDQLLCNKTVYTDGLGGSITKLSLTLKNAYTLHSEDDVLTSMPTTADLVAAVKKRIEG